MNTRLDQAAIAAIRARARLERRNRRAALIAAIVMYAILGVAGAAAVYGDFEGRPTLRVAVIVFSAWLTLLVSVFAVVTGRRMLAMSRDELPGSCVTVTTPRLRRCWTITDSDTHEPVGEQWFRAKGVRGVLRGPLAFHASFGEPREATITYTKRSKVLVEVDGLSVWGDAVAND